MMNKATWNARMIFAWMVPLTVIAFVIGAISTVAISENVNGVNLVPQWQDYIGLSIATFGVAMFNWYEEMP